MVFSFWCIHNTLILKTVSLQFVATFTLANFSVSFGSLVFSKDIACRNSVCGGKIGSYVKKMHLHVDQMFSLFFKC